MIRVSGIYYLLEERLYTSKFFWSLYSVSGIKSVKSIYDACILRIFYEFVLARRDSNDLLAANEHESQALAKGLAKLDNSYLTLKRWKDQLSAELDSRYEETMKLPRNLFLKYPSLLKGMAGMLAHYAVQFPSNESSEEWKRMAILFRNAYVLLDAEIAEIGDHGSVPKLAAAFERIASPVITKFYEEKMDQQVLLLA